MSRRTSRPRAAEARLIAAEAARRELRVVNAGDGAGPSSPRGRLAEDHFHPNDPGYAALAMTGSLIDPSTLPSGDGCVECLAAAGWWLHLRRCAECGHIGCCDTSPGQHASAHARATGHSIITSFEPGEDWYYDYRTDQMGEGPPLAPPDHHPLDQPTPGPAGKVPSDWE